MPHAAEVYARLLLPKLLGFPLWYPEPDEGEGFSDQYRNEGVRVGDVGLITWDGKFDFLFNICVSADHPINTRGVPSGFNPVTSVEISEYRQHPPGTYIATNLNTGQTLAANVAVQTTPTIPVSFNTAFHFTSSTTEGAVLVLPDGGSSKNMRNMKPFFDQASKYALSWYKYAEERRGRMGTKGSLCLVTGCDRTTTWGLASFSNPSGGHNVSLEFRGAQAMAAGVSRAYHWATNGPADVRLDPVSQDKMRSEQLLAQTAPGLHRRRQHRHGESGSQEVPSLISAYLDVVSEQETRVEQRLNNQCVFVRGFRISVRDSLLPLPMPRVKVSDANHTDSLDIFRRSSSFNMSTWSGVRRSATDNGGNGGIADSGKRSRSDQAQRSVAGFSATADGKEDFVIEMIPDLCELNDPLTVLNNWLLTKNRDAQVAVTHDEDFFALMDKNEDRVPADDDIIRRANQTFTMEFDEGTRRVSLYPNPRMSAVQYNPSKEAIREVVDAQTRLSNLNISSTNDTARHPTEPQPQPQITPSSSASSPRIYKASGAYLPPFRHPPPPPQAKAPSPALVRAEESATSGSQSLIPSLFTGVDDWMKEARRTSMVGTKPPGPAADDEGDRRIIVPKQSGITISVQDQNTVLAGSVRAPTSNLSSFRRTCVNCRVRKVRCEGADDPPCARCKTTGMPCVFRAIKKAHRLNDVSSESSEKNLPALKSAPAQRTVPVPTRQACAPIPATLPESAPTRGRLLPWPQLSEGRYPLPIIQAPPSAFEAPPGYAIGPLLRRTGSPLSAQEGDKRGAPQPAPTKSKARLEEH